jgi:hypothetical protein
LTDNPEDKDNDALIGDSEDDDDEPEYKAPTKAAKHPRKKSPTKPKLPKLPKTAAPKKPRARKQKGPVDAAQVAKQTHISDDNALFSEWTMKGCFLS